MKYPIKISQLFEINDNRNSLKKSTNLSHQSSIQTKAYLYATICSLVEKFTIELINNTKEQCNVSVKEIQEKLCITIKSNNSALITQMRLNKSLLLDSIKEGLYQKDLLSTQWELQLFLKID